MYAYYAKGLIAYIYGYILVLEFSICKEPPQLLYYYYYYLFYALLLLLHFSLQVVVLLYLNMQRLTCIHA